MKERLKKFIFCLVFIPVGFALLLIGASLILMAPILALINPDLIKIK